MKIYQKISVLSDAIANCQKSNNREWEIKHQEKLDKIMEGAPSGSGFDNGTELFSCSPEKIKFSTAFHHMNPDGYYTEWTLHCVVVTPAFIGFNIRTTGRNVNDIKNYIDDTFSSWLSEEVKDA